MLATVHVENNQGTGRVCSATEALTARTNSGQAATHFTAAAAASEYPVYKQKAIHEADITEPPCKSAAGTSVHLYVLPHSMSHLDLCLPAAGFTSIMSRML